MFGEINREQRGADLFASPTTTTPQPSSRPWTAPTDAAAMARGNKFKPQGVVAVVQEAAAPAAAPLAAPAAAPPALPPAPRARPAPTAGAKRSAPVAAAAPAATPPHPATRHKLPTTVAPAGAGSNWAALQAAKLVKVGGGRRPPAAGAAPPAAPPAAPRAVGSVEGATRVLAVDCEMVGVGPGGTRSSLAR